MDIPEQILEVDGIPVCCFVTDTGTISAYILPDSRVEYWKTKMREFKESRGEHIYTDTEIETLRKRVSRN